MDANPQQGGGRPLYNGHGMWVNLKTLVPKSCGWSSQETKEAQI